MGDGFSIRLKQPSEYRMNNPGDYSSPSTKRFSKEPEYEELIEKLLELDVSDVAMMTIDGTYNGRRKELESIGERIKELETLWADDIDFKRLKAIYEDLESDTKKWESWTIDSSTYEMGRQLNEEVKRIGIRREKVEDLTGKIKEKAETLRSIGVPVEYAVLSQNPERSPTVILFLQSHIDPNGYLDLQAEASQNTIDKYVASLLDKKVSTELHVEGVSEGMPLQEFLDSQRARSIGGLRLSKDRKDLAIKASESYGITKIGMSDPTIFQSRDYEGLRLILGSILFVHNMMESIGENADATIMATMGLGHEERLNGTRVPQESFLSISEMIAFEGANVLVVDAIPADSFAFSGMLVPPEADVPTINTIPTEEKTEAMHEKSWRFKEIGEITREVAELEDKIMREEYNKWASDPATLKTTEWIFGAGAKILTSEKWIKYRGFRYLDELGYDVAETRNAREDQLPENYLRVMYEIYYKDAEKSGNSPCSYLEWLRSGQENAGKD